MAQPRTRNLAVVSHFLDSLVKELPEGSSLDQEPIAKIQRNLELIDQRYWVIMAGVGCFMMVAFSTLGGFIATSFGSFWPTGWIAILFAVIGVLGVRQSIADNYNIAVMEREASQLLWGPTMRPLIMDYLLRKMPFEINTRATQIQLVFCALPAIGSFEQIPVPVLEPLNWATIEPTIEQLLIPFREEVIE